MVRTTLSTGKQPRVSRKGTLLIVLGALVVLVGIGWIVGAAVGLYSDAKDTSERAASLQAIAAGVGLAATLLLLAVTGWYAVLTRGILRQSGPVVGVDLRIGWLPRHGGSMLTAPLSSLQAKAPPDERYPVPTWAFCLRNSGNAATKVTSLAVKSKEAGISIQATSTAAGPAPIFTLDAHTSETSCIELDLVMSGINAWQQAMGTNTRHVRAEVTLGSGLVVVSPWVSR